VSDFVLIHSTGQGPDGWRRVVRELEQQGHQGHAVDLPTDQPHLLAADYAKIIRRQAAGVPDSIVIAHSGSGPLLPAAARVLQAAHQVWLAAWVPDPAATFVEEVALRTEAAFNPEWIGKDPTTDADVATSFVYHDCDAETLDWALTTRRLFLPRAVYSERIDPDNGIPSTYIVATEDRTIRPDWQRQMAHERLGVEPIEIATGHCPNVSQPELLVTMLTAVASV
jgi:hypothetical protein